MYYISLDLSQRALQTNEKLFSNSKFVFELLAKNWKIFNDSTNNKVGFMQARWGGICADQHALRINIGPMGKDSVA